MNPSVDQTKLDRATKFLQAANEDFPTRQEVASTIAEVVKALQALASTVKQLIATGDDAAVKQALSAFAASPAFKSLQGSVAKEIPGQLADLGKRLDRVSRETSAGAASLASRLADIDARGLDQRLSALESADEIEETPESIRNKLESLKNTPSALAIDAIFGLADRLDELEKAARQRGSGGTVIAYSRGAIKLYDLSDQLDGSKKTFALPAFWRVISVQSTSSPTTFRPTVDYTTDGNLMTLTFTSEVDAASTLSAGQTLTVIYAEP